MVTEELAARAPHLKEEGHVNFLRLFHCNKAVDNRWTDQNYNPPQKKVPQVC